MIPSPGREPGRYSEDRTTDCSAPPDCPWDTAMACSNCWATDLGCAPGFPCFSATGDFDRNGSPALVVATGTAVLVALNTAGHPPLLAQVTTRSTFPIGGTQIAGTVTLGGPAPVGGALVTLSSNNPAAFFQRTSSEISLPPLEDDPKTAKGHDEFSVTENSGARRCPVYHDKDTKAQLYLAATSGHN